ncbi:HD domain-containing protein [Candidatus Cardinium hertigii]|uniref:Uncharacterized protein n=1 Tax=Candidatus Cardinium hertigii TaxID=247481 RepID=A0A2Z3LDA7_9BACT|nr:HD domain-containing protein [Candidatus Cardinium hertigii]AWN81786.1 hypothetical protein DK880_00460 [Candidatus Cardinium hertigii]
MIKKLIVRIGNESKVAWMALYTLLSTLLVFSIIGVQGYLIYLAVLQLAGASFLLLCYVFLSEDKIPNRLMVSFYCLSVLFSFMGTFWYWSNTVDAKHVLFLLLIPSLIILLLLPLALRRGYVFLMFVCYITTTSKLVQLWPLCQGVLYAQLGLGIFAFIVILQCESAVSARKNFHLKKQCKVKDRKDPCDHLVDAEQSNKATLIAHKGGLSDYDREYLEFEEEFLKRIAQSDVYTFEEPAEITIDELMVSVETALKKEKLRRVPRLLVIKQDAHVPDKIFCKVKTIVRLLVTAVLRMIDLDFCKRQCVHIKLSSTQLQYNFNNFMEDGSLSNIRFPAVAIAINNITVHPAALPELQTCYQDGLGDYFYSDNGIVPMYWNRSMEIIRDAAYTHYGYVEVPNCCTLLVVLPCNSANSIEDKMIAQLPLKFKESVTVKEEKASVRILESFYWYASRIIRLNAAEVGGILLLLRRCYGFQRHASGKLLYVRAVGIAETVASWVFYSYAPVYAALLYDLARYSSLPLSYLKANYDPSVFYLIEMLLRIDKQIQLRDLPSVINDCRSFGLRELILSIIYIKLAERVYDLNHAIGYTSLETVKHMVQETLSTYVELAERLQSPEIKNLLTYVAKKALENGRKK